MTSSSTSTPNGHDQKLRSFLNPLLLDDDTLYRLAYRFSIIYGQRAANSTENFFPTPVTYLPTGRETGRYLAVYVGLSYLRVAFIELLGESAEVRKDYSERQQRVRRTLEKAWPIEDHLKRDHAGDLFAWIGDCIAEVVADSLSSDAPASTGHDEPAELEMGIAFCFPIMYVHIGLLMSAFPTS
jgi:hexokinase